MQYKFISKFPHALFEYECNSPKVSVRCDFARISSQTPFDMMELFAMSKICNNIRIMLVDNMYLNCA